MIKKFLLLFSFIFMTTAVYCQANKKFIDTGSVKNQFDYLLNESNNFQEFKVVKQQWILKLKSNVSDSISKTKITFSNNVKIISEQLKEIDSLTNEVASITNEFEKLNTEKQQVSFLGIKLEKSLYKSLTYTLILIFIGLFLFYFFKFKQSNVQTKEAKLSLKEVEEEYDEHRKKALEREQKIMRKLQDELNKQKKD
jgi:preprotein translocase subunit SecF